jgi:hypothetical protein
MSGSRDDFSEPTKRNLARRVNYKCSYPECLRPTEGPHTDPNKYLSVGVAAHITAASDNGPRYNSSLSSVQRKDITNGIWLCETHAKMIDKDAERYSAETLNEWKEIAEEIALCELEERKKEEKVINPQLEAEIRSYGGGQTNEGFNIYETNKKYGNIPISPLSAIINFSQHWHYQLVIFNNSSLPAYNIKIENNSPLTYIEKISKVNNLAPLDSIKMEIKLDKSFIGTGKESSEIIKAFVPQDLIGSTFNIIYQNENKDELVTTFVFEEDGIQIIDA